jgi:hypothetical protein
MAEPIVTLGMMGALGAYVGKDVLNKLLGPTAEYLGSGIRDLTEKRFQTAGRIFSKASSRLGEKIEQDGAIPPKLLKQVIDNGSFADDDVEVEYLGGVVASSRSDQSRDNRGVVVAKLIDNLSNYQLRAHYLIYRSISDIHRTTGITPLTGDGRSELGIFIPLPAFVDAMAFSESEQKRLETLVSHIFFGLAKHSLIDDHFKFGPKESMQTLIPNAEHAGIICQPSVPGIELFLWAFGEGGAKLTELFSPSFNPLIDGLPVGFSGAVPLTPNPPRQIPPS